MKKLVLFCFAACLCAVASAQKLYFLYLQSDDQTPFYVKMGDKIHSSAASGYLILPNLADGNHAISLGFAQSSAPEAKFSVTINQKDRGFIVKNFEGGLALFDVQELSLIKSDAALQDSTVYVAKTDRFSTILSKAANDPGLLKVPAVKKDEPAKQKPAETEVLTAKEVVTAKAEDQKPVEQPLVDTPTTQPVTETAAATEPKPETPAFTDSLAVQPVVKEPKEAVVEVIPQEEKKEEAGLQVAAFKPSVINRYSESSTTEGFGVIYFDKKEDGTDTIRILIPSPRVRLVGDAEAAPPTEVLAKTETAADTVVAVASKATENAPPETVAPAPVVSETTCKNIASEKDFLKLRRKMASRDNNEAMLDDARKEFRGKCYSVEQVRNLSVLFLTSASKYQFFDIAYYYVTDKSNFALLGEEIKDEHYAKRFKALIGE